MKISPYLIFDGQAEEAFKFYETVLKGKLEVMMTFAQAPDCKDIPQEQKTRIMHTSLRLGDQVLMASDSMCGQPYEGIKGCSVALSPDSVAECERIFKALSEGGKVVMALQETFWAASFGMLVDRFGVSWMVSCEKPHA